MSRESPDELRKRAQEKYKLADIKEEQERKKKEDEDFIGCFLFGFFVFMCLGVLLESCSS